MGSKQFGDNLSEISGKVIDYKNATKYRKFGNRYNIAANGGAYDTLLSVSGKGYAAMAAATVEENFSSPSIDVKVQIDGVARVWKWTAINQLAGYFPIAPNPINLYGTSNEVRYGDMVGFTNNDGTCHPLIQGIPLFFEWEFKLLVRTSVTQYVKMFYDVGVFPS